MFELVKKTIALSEKEHESDSSTTIQDINSIFEALRGELGDEMQKMMDANQEHSDNYKRLRIYFYLASIDQLGSGLPYFNRKLTFDDATGAMEDIEALAEDGTPIKKEATWAKEILQRKKEEWKQTHS